jgi:hypothetical protein
MDIGTLYKDFKRIKGVIKNNNGSVLCYFIPLDGLPYSEILKPDKNGYAKNSRGWKFIIIPNSKRIYGESLPQEIR